MNDFGINFKLTGADKAKRDMASLKGEYGALSGAVDQHSQRIQGSVNRMSLAMKASLVAAAGALGGLMAAVTPLKLAGSRDELTNEQANLRALGLDDAGIQKIESAAETFSTRVAGVTKEAYTKASYDVVSAFAQLSTDEQAKITDIALNTGKATKMSADHATKLFGSLWGAAGDKMKAEGAENFVQKWSGAIYTAVKELKTTGEELASAAKNSMSMLMEAGWKPEQMAAFWGQLITSGLSGEQAGTALKQMAIKERAGFGKLLAQTSSNWTDTEWLKGDAKHMAEARNKGLIEGFAAQGAELFKNDPVKWLERMGGAFDKLKASGADYKKVLGEIFGEETINAMVQFFEKRGQMSETIDKIAKGNYGDVRRIVEEEMSKGIGPAKSILSQLWSNLQQTMGKTFETGVTGKLQWIGDKLLQVNALWNALFNDTGPQHAIDSLRAAGGDALVDLYEKLQGFPDNVSAFTEGVKGGFMGMLGGLGEVDSRINSIVEALGKPDEEKWRLIGEQFGQLAGTSLTGFVDSLKEVKNTAAEIFGFLSPVLEILKFAGSGYKLAGQAWNQHGLREDYYAGTSGLGSMFDNSDLYDKPNVTPEQAYPGWTGPRAPEGPMARNGGSGQTGAPQINVQPEVRVEAPQVNVRVGERQLTDIVVDIVKSIRSRYRQGAGDGWVDAWE
jgi:hypothetical protein